MQFNIYVIPVDDRGAALEEMNRFLRSHRILEEQHKLISGKMEYPLSLSHIKIMDREDLRIISRYQMEIFYNDQEMLIRNKSNSLPVFVGDKIIEKDEIAQLNSGDKIIIDQIKLIYLIEDN